MGHVHTNEPLTSIEAFALALVEASSRLTVAIGILPSDAVPSAPGDDGGVASSE